MTALSEKTAPSLFRAIAQVAGYPGWWAVAGGWAVDLHLGRVTREHADVELAILRRDASLARRALEGRWSVVRPHPAGRAESGTVEPWSGGPLPPGAHQLRVSDAQGTLELLLQSAAGTSWRYRRDERVSRPLAAASLERDGVPYLAPEIVLLFKSKHRRPKDEMDLAHLLPDLSTGQREWLVGALQATAPANPWLSRLANEES